MVKRLEINNTLIELMIIDYFYGLLISILLLNMINHIV